MAAAYDFVCIGAHADDVELGMGGTVAKMVSRGRRGLLVDLSDASMGTRGTCEERIREAAAAAGILGVDRRNLGFRDGHLSGQDPSLLLAVVGCLREARAPVVFTHPTVDRHPDHEVAATVVREAFFKAGLAKWPDPGRAWTPFRPSRLFHWMGPRDGDPDFCVDVGDHWETRRASIAAYVSQFGPDGPATAISGESFHGFLEARARVLGSRTRCRLAEGFTCVEIPEIADPCALPRSEF
jgi:bacillithiol biosynthesis deacetylase BshB1